MTEIRSFRRVFDLERRVYSIDRLRLNPGGVPVRGIAYLIAVVSLSLFLTTLPLVGDVVAIVPWFLRDLVLPLATASVLTTIRIEGRTFHLAGGAALRYWLAPRRLVGVDRRTPSTRHWHPPELLILPDGSDARLRRLRYTGPGAVLVTVGHECVAPRHRRRAGLVLREQGRVHLAEGRVVLLRAGASMVVRPVEDSEA